MDYSHRDRHRHWEEGHIQLEEQVRIHPEVLTSGTIHLVLKSEKMTRKSAHIQENV